MNFDPVVLDFISNSVGIFLGAVLSFSLWLLGEHIIRWHAHVSDRNFMLREISDELFFNIGILKSGLEYTKKSLTQEGDIPVHVPRLQRSASNFALISGNVRLIRSRRKQRIIWQVDTVAERHNEFCANTEQLFTTLLLRENSLGLVRTRLSAYYEHLAKTKKLLEDYYVKLLRKDLPEIDKALPDK